MNEKRLATVKELVSALQCAENGVVACNALSKLRDAALAGDVAAINALSDYAKNGSIDHMRTHATALLADVAIPGDSNLIQVFRNLLDDPLGQYWAIKGVLKCEGIGAYSAIAALAFEQSVALPVRANAIKQLALASQQLFDRQLPTDPGHWSEADLRLDELGRWVAAGFPRGPGHPSPIRDPAMDNPVTEFEKTVSRLEKKLSVLRGSDDPANPRNRLVPALPEHMEAISKRWSLPSRYLEFLTRFSPMRVQLPDKRFCNELALYGAAELINRQIGYGYNQDRSPIEEWPADLIVIADDGGDPFALDLSCSSGTDAPVVSALHGMGQWEFSTVAPSFTEFLEDLI